MDRDQQRHIVEALILAAPEPVSAARLAEIVPGLKPARAKELAAELRESYEREDRAFELWEVAGGYQIRTRADYAPWVKQLQKERALRLSRAALETLAVVAYKQPVTRAEIEHIRGVDVGAVLRSLVERKLIRIAGHREVPGRPMLYGTGRRFLEVFGLDKLDDLPTLREIQELMPGHGEDAEDAAEAADAAALGADETPDGSEDEGLPGDPEPDLSAEALAERGELH